jgi:D-serine deaminase-like pyridoxal phosphate-dependent protein
MKWHELQTPALLVDMDAMERNLAKMARFFSTGPTSLRPHYKNHKCPALARRQIQAGAFGMTCATLSEAEALVANGIQNVLISSEIAGAPKIRRFVELASQAEIIAVVDNPGAVDALAAVARRQRCRCGVLVDVNVGQNRTGIKPGEGVLELARKVLAEGLWLRGLMGYEGHVAHLDPGPAQNSAYDSAMSALMDCCCILQQNGIPVEIVSTGGTGTYSMTRRFPAITEFQAGSYLLMDTEYSRTCSDFELALSVLGTIISKTEGERLVADVGLKSISGEHGMPVIKEQDGLRLRKLNAEHGIIDILESPTNLAPGDTIEIWAHYSDATVNLHERMYGIRGGEVEEVFKLEG